MPNPDLRLRPFLSLVLLVTAFASGERLAAQNLEPVGQLSYPTTLSDVWGWADAGGHEYALVGVRDGISIVDVSSDPANPAELFFFSGPPSTWRDLKTWGDHAYVIHDAVDPGGSGAPGVGLVILDLSNLPVSVDTVTRRFFGGLNLTISHNIFIDENGVLYVCGYAGTGGVAMLDLTADPEDPVLVGTYPTPYVHDLYVRGDTMWTAEIYNGEFGVVDVTNKAAPVVLARVQTPTAFAHNLWLSDDGATLVTTDEVNGGFIGSFDVSDLSDIRLIDEERSSPGSNVIPHNAFWIGDHVITSYYRDGVTIHDASRPSNLVQVGRYDTSPSSGPGFDGCWGVYPYTPSGLVYATDVLSGFYVLDPTYAQAAWLEGTVSSSAGGTVFGAVVRIDGTAGVAESDLFGTYGTGTDSSGTFTVSVEALGYAPETVSGVTLNPGAVTLLDVTLDPLPTTSATGLVTDSASGAPLEGAFVRFTHPDFSFEAVTDATGRYTIDTLFVADYTVLAGQWGQVTRSREAPVADGGPDIDLALPAGIYDDFSFDFDWQAIGSTWLDGSWDRAEPRAFDPGFGFPITPGADAPGDAGGYAYVTGNDDEVDFVHAGSVTLRSPEFDPRSLDRPTLRFDAWVFNTDFLAAVSNDGVLVKLSGADGTVTIDTLRAANALSPAWRSFEYVLEDYSPLGPGMRVIFTAEADGVPFAPEDALEAGIDRFRVEAFERPSGLWAGATASAEGHMMPNPNPGQATLRLEGVADGPARLAVYGITGRHHGTWTVAVRAGRAAFRAPSLGEGLYLYELRRDGERLARGRFTVAR
jgi:choice-of-anchor B domain-containing protein